MRPLLLLALAVLLAGCRDEPPRTYIVRAKSTASGTATVITSAGVAMRSSTLYDIARIDEPLCAWYHWSDGWMGFVGHCDPGPGDR